MNNILAALVVLSPVAALVFGLVVGARYRLIVISTSCDQVMSREWQTARIAEEARRSLHRCHDAR